MRKILFFYFIYVLQINSQDLSATSIYIVGRGTLSKKELIGDRFNLINKNLTHVGIGLYINDTLKIYHVSSNKINNNSSLIIEEIDKFKDEVDIFYMGIWEYPTNKKNINKILSILNDFLSREIKFDRNFDISDNKALYCSEFVFKALNEMSNFNFKPLKKHMFGIEKDLLGKNEIKYFPVDLFLTNKKFSQKLIKFL